MKCPECGAHARNMQTTTRADATKRRRYVCNQGHRFTTWQRPGGKEQHRPPPAPRS